MGRKTFLRYFYFDSNAFRKYWLRDLVFLALGFEAIAWWFWGTSHEDRAIGVLFYLGMILWGKSYA